MKSQHIQLSLIVSVAALALSVVVASYTMGGNSMPGGQANVGFINFPAVLEQSEAGKSITKQITPYRTKLLQDAEAKAKLYRQEQEMVKKMEEDQAGAAADLQKKIDTWNVEAQRRQAVLDTAVKPAMDKVDQALRAEVEALAEEGKLSAILPMQSAFYVNKKMDLTAEAIQRLDKVLRKVEVKLPEEK